MLQDHWLILCLGPAYLLMAMADLRLHRTNLEFLRFVGGEEQERRLFATYFNLYYLAGLFCFLAMYHSGFSAPTHPLIISTAILLALLGAGLRFWSMNSLGRLWSYRCIYIPGMPSVRIGPYRILRHPEYVARFLELFGLMIASGATSVLWPLMLVYLWLVKKMTRCENLQIRHLQGPDEMETGFAKQSHLRVEY